MILHMGIPVCIQRSPFAYRDLVNYNPCMHTGIHWCLYASRDCKWWDPCMHTGIYIYPHLHIGIDLDPRMHTGIAWQHSPYAYRDRDQSPYAYRDRWDPRMNTGIICHAIPVCIRGSRSIPLCIWASCWSPYAYRDCMTLIPVCIWGSSSIQGMHTGVLNNACMHTGIFQSLTVCIQELFPYEKSSLVSPYA